MPVTDKTFQVVYNNIPVYITPGRMGEKVSYTASYGGSPIILTQTEGAEGQGIWTSTPDVKNTLTEGLGKLIEEHINSKE